MKKSISLLLAIIVLAMLLAGCNDTAQPVDTSDQITTTVASPDTTAAAVEDTATAEPAVETTAAHEPTHKGYDDGVLKVMAIGNSFSTDCMEYLYGLLRAGGVNKIVLGNLYYGGCSLAEHATFAKGDKASYTYYKNTSGSWSKQENYKMSTALADENWDIITFQQTSKTCGLRQSYGKVLTQLVEYVRERCPEASFVWNATWAYQSDSTHSSFPNYDNSQQKMYDMIIDCVENCIENTGYFDYVIPCMTAIQNARTSYLGDTLTRDGYHMNYLIGRYTVGLCWFSALTGLDASNASSYNPNKTSINEDMVKVAVESVNNAIKTPKKVTESTIKTGVKPDTTPVSSDVVLVPADFFEADKAEAATKGIDLTKYTLLEWEYLENTYWNCTSTAGTTTPKSTASTYQQNVCSKKKFTLDEVPVGTVFVIDDGWQVRIEKFDDATNKYSGTRPGFVTERVYVMDQAFVGNSKYIVWNIATNPKSNISKIYAQAAAHIRVYIPKA